jgi:hypothetical protein
MGPIKNAPDSGEQDAFPKIVNNQPAKFAATASQFTKLQKAAM